MQAWSRREPLPAGRQRNGFNLFNTETAAKRLGLLHELAPKAVRIAVLVNRTNATAAETTLREVQGGAHVIGLQIQVINASSQKRE